MLPNRRCEFTSKRDKPEPLLITSHYYISYPPSLNIIFHKKFDTRQLADLFYYIMVRLRNDFVNFTYGFERGSHILKIALAFNIPTVYNATITLNFVDLIVKDASGSKYLLENKNLTFTNVEFLENAVQQKAYSILGLLLYILVWVVVVVSAVTVNKEVFFLIMRSCQYVELLLFLNIAKPNNLLALTKHFQRLFLFSLPNPILHIQTTDCGLKGSLSQKGLTCFFLDNTGGAVLCLLVYCCWMMIVRIVANLAGSVKNRVAVVGESSKLEEQKRTTQLALEESQLPVMKRVIRQMVNHFAYPSLLNMFSCFCVDCTFYSFLQIMHVKTAPKYFAFNSIIGIILFFLSSFFVLATFILISTYERDEAYYLENKAHFLENLTTKKPAGCQKYFHPNLMLKNFTLCCLVVGLNDYQFIHCLAFLVVQFLFNLKGLMPLPYADRGLSVREMVHEWYLLAVGLLILLATDLLKVFSNQAARYHILGNLQSVLTALYLFWTVFLSFALIYKQSLAPLVKQYKEKKAKAKSDSQDKEGKRLIDDSLEAAILPIEQRKINKIRLDALDGKKLTIRKPSVVNDLASPSKKTSTIRKKKTGALSSMSKTSIKESAKKVLAKEEGSPQKTDQGMIAENDPGKPQDMDPSPDVKDKPTETEFNFSIKSEPHPVSSPIAKSNSNISKKSSKSKTKKVEIKKANNSQPES